MQKILRWFSISGFLAAAGYFLERGNWEIALTSIVIPLLLGLIPFLFQQSVESGKRSEPWIKSLWGTLTFKKKYFEMIRYQNRDFDIKGLSTQTNHTLELEQVFIELNLQTQVAHRASPDPIKSITAPLHGESHPIWRFVTLLSREEGANNPKIVIVGPPGCGKTTLLRHMALLLTLSRRNPKIREYKFKKIPILFYIRDHVAEVQSNPAILLPELAETNTAKWDVPTPPKWFSRKLKNGECLVLMDGLDEVADPEGRRKMVAWLEKQIHAYPGNAFIITSRPHGYKENTITGVSILEVLPFNRSQIDTFVQKWYFANEVKSHLSDDTGVRMIAKSGADDLLRRLEKTPTLMELAVNPLLLTMIATVHRFRSALPGRRVELYKEICEVFLGKRQETKGIPLDLVPAQKQFILQSLAYRMMTGNTREIKRADAVEIIRHPLSMVSPKLDPESFLKSIEQQSGLLLERESGIYSFAHKTFQEYLTSMYILDKNLESELYSRFNEEWWHEVIKLYSAQSDATQIVTKCLDQDPPTASALSLAIQCLEEAHQVQPRLREITEKILLENAEDRDPELRKIVAQALLSNRIKHMAAISPSVYIDTKPITNAEYQLFVDEMVWRKKGEFQLAHWNGSSFPPGSAHEPGCGVTPEDALAFCEWMTDIHAGSGEWYFRLPNQDEAAFLRSSNSYSFWISSKTSGRAGGSAMKIEIWRDARASWDTAPHQFFVKTAQEDIKLIVSTLRVEGRIITEIKDDNYPRFINSLRSLLQISSNPDKALVEAAERLFRKINQLSFSQPVDFSYGMPNMEFYDQTISDMIEKITKPDFEEGVLTSISYFIDFLTLNPRTVNRYRPLVTAFAFEFLSVWAEKNKSILASINTSGFQHRIDYLVDRYADYLAVLARQKKLSRPFEGIVFVKQVKEQKD